MDKTPGIDKALAQQCIETLKKQSHQATHDELILLLAHAEGLAAYIRCILQWKEQSDSDSSTSHNHP